MDSLFSKHDRYYFETSTEIVRECINEIDWDARLISIQGPKEVGKSTLIRQFIKLNYPPHSRKALYCSMDSLYFSSHSISELVYSFVSLGGERLFLDEIHKYAVCPVQQQPINRHRAQDIRGDPPFRRSQSGIWQGKRRFHGRREIYFRGRRTG